MRVYKYYIIMDKNITEKKELNKKDENVKAKNSDKIPFINIVQYFIIYSILGLVLEMFFGFLVEGVIESRKNFLYGPFSCIYGVGGTFMTLILHDYKNNKIKLFLGGMLIGLVIEYAVSFFGEIIFNVKWWDYSAIPFNVNGRVCLLFGIIWGTLAVFLITTLNPWIDKILKKLSPKLLKIITIILVIFMVVNYFVTSFALKIFNARLVLDYGVELQKTNIVIQEYEQWINNKIFKTITDTMFSNEIMLKAFPNLLITLNDGTVVRVSSLLPEIQPYYFKLFDGPVDLKNFVIEALKK